MSVFNCQAYLSESLDSLLNQTFRDFELVVIDDASTDDTPSILNEYARQDSRIVLIRNDTNLGLAPSLNCGLRICRADLVARADGDDSYSPNRLEKQMRFMALHPEVGVSSTGFQYVDEKGRRLGTYQNPLKDRHIKFLLLFGTQFVHASAIYRRKLVLEAGGYDEALARGPEDYDLWARLLNRTTFANVPFPLIRIRSHSTSTTQSGRNGFWERAFEISRRLISTYLGNEVKLEDATAVGTLFMGYSRLQKEALTAALNLIDRVLLEGAKRESPDTLRAFDQLFARALLKQSAHQTYLEPMISKRLLRHALSLHPRLAISGMALFQITRLHSPRKMRDWTRKILHRRRRSIVQV